MRNLNLNELAEKVVSREIGLSNILISELRMLGFQTSYGLEGWEVISAAKAIIDKESMMFSFEDEVSTAQDVINGKITAANVTSHQLDCLGFSRGCWAIGVKQGVLENRANEIMTVKSRKDAEMDERTELDVAKAVLEGDILVANVSNLELSLLGFDLSKVRDLGVTQEDLRSAARRTIEQEQNDKTEFARLLFRIIAGRVDQNGLRIYEWSILGFDIEEGAPDVEWNKVVDRAINRLSEFVGKIL